MGLGSFGVRRLRTVRPPFFLLLFFRGDGHRMVGRMYVYMGLL